MFKDVKIIDALSRERKKVRGREEVLLEEVHKILNDGLFTEKNILQNLQTYNQTFDLLSEEGLDKNKIFGVTEIKNICIQYDLRFLDSQLYKGEFPSEALYAIKELSREQRKNFRNFKILGAKDSFRNKNVSSDPMLFAEAVYGNYYLVHQWDHKVAWYKKLVAFPMRRFETLLGTIVCLSLILTLTLPNNLLIYKNAFPYWDMHRIAVFFHFMILFSGLTVFFLFSFHKNFSSNTWNDDRL